jgi:hypothetical protein
MKKSSTELKLTQSKISDYEQQIHRFSKQLSELDSLKNQVEIERAKNRDFSQRHDQFLNELQRDVREKQSIIDRQTVVEQQNRETLAGHINDLRQKSNKIVQLETKIHEQIRVINNQDQELTLAKQQVEGTEKVLRELQLKHDSYVAELKQRTSENELLKKKLEDMTQHSFILQKDLQNANINVGQYYAHIQELEQKLQDQPPLIVPVKFEEDILNDIARQSQPNNQILQDAVKILQIIDYFDSSKPDGWDLRSMFISDQICLRKDGRQTMFGSFDEFDAFDHLSRVVRGSQQISQSRETAVVDAVVAIQKLLSLSSEEIIPGITYKVLNDQINELQSSNLYLTGRTLYPYTQMELGTTDVAYGFTASNRSNQTLSRPDLFTDGFNFASDHTLASSTTTSSVEKNVPESHQYIISSNASPAPPSNTADIKVKPAAEEQQQTVTDHQHQQYASKKERVDRPRQKKVYKKRPSAEEAVDTTPTTPTTPTTSEQPKEERRGRSKPSRRSKHSTPDAQETTTPKETTQDSSAPATTSSVQPPKKKFTSRKTEAVSPSDNNTTNNDPVTESASEGDQNKTSGRGTFKRRGSGRGRGRGRAIKYIPENPQSQEQS